MPMLAHVYNCPKCGEVWQIEIATEIDCDNDDIYEYPVCSTCYSEVTQKTTGGVPCMHELSDEELFWLDYAAEEEC